MAERTFLEYIQDHDMPNSPITVKMFRKTIGKINKVQGGWQYTPKNSKHSGEVYPTLKACKDSLEEM